MTRMEFECGNEEKRRQTIAYVVSDIPFFLSHRLALALAAQKAGYNIVVAAPINSDFSELTPYTFETQKIRLNRRSKNLLLELHSLFSIYSALRSSRPNIVHLVTAKPIFYGGISARILKIPSLAALTGLGYAFTHQTLKTRLLRRFLSVLYRTALNSPLTHVVFQNRDDLKIATENGFVRRATTSLIGGSGTDLSIITPKPFPEGPSVVLMPCRMLRDKGVVEFVEAARQLKASGCNAIFRLLGDPDYNNPTSLSVNELKQFANEGCIEWLPHTSDMDGALAQCHLVVLPSYREGFPKTLIDAAAAGRASVTTDVPGCRDAVVLGKTGVLCEARSSESLETSIRELLSNRELLEKMGNEARAHAEKYFDIRSVENAHLEIYDALANRSIPKPM